MWSACGCPIDEDMCVVVLVSAAIEEELEDGQDETKHTHTSIYLAPAVVTRQMYRSFHAQTVGYGGRGAGTVVPHAYPQSVISRRLLSPE